MATVTKCDRCGKVYKKNTKLYGAAVLKNVAAFSQQNNRMCNYDLCDGCFDDFFIFMQGANQKEVANEMS